MTDYDDLCIMCSNDNYPLCEECSKKYDSCPVCSFIVPIEDIVNYNDDTDACISCINQYGEHKNDV